MNRYYVLVSLDAGTFHTDALPEAEQQSAARLVASLLRLALSDRDIDAKRVSAVALAPDDIDRITIALRGEATRGEESMRALDAKWQAALPKLREAIDRIVEQKEKVPIPMSTWTCPWCKKVNTSTLTCASCGSGSPR